ncbi:PREDICTED: protein PTHB1 [Papilio xuthus]|uniref:Protein PTHB1 n=1 Tax=Papilio xuthus TaxID=66420 RepID=A0AAJ6ZYC2_PAPXU|nr:PREDICTED: protein PTHB1 [Papilio xuthus]
MSLFKVKQWWSNATNTENKDEQTFSCMKIDKFISHNDSDCVLLGEGTLLKLFKPSLDQDGLLLETELSDIILQIETGKFIGMSGDREIIVLHPQSYVIYELHRKEGLTDAGEQNRVTAVIKHAFKRRAYNMTVGPFGSSKSRDLICVQSLDGTLSFFDQDTFLFMCIFNDILIPGPVAYVMTVDMFVICKSTWTLEIYSYQQLRESSELSLRQNKTNIPQWTYNAGEEISAVQVIRTSSNFSSIIALSERHLYCFQDNGLMKALIRFDYTPICFHSYLIGWYYEPGARLLIMVASDDSKLYVYEGTKLLWACDLMMKAVSLSRCFINSLPGGVVTLSLDGIISVNYLGTEPDLNPNVNIVNEIVSPVEVQRELDSVDEALKLIISDDKESVADVPYLEKTISIKMEIGPIENHYEYNILESDKNVQFMKCPLIITIICKEPKLIQNIQITYICSSPFVNSDNSKYIDDVDEE